MQRLTLLAAATATALVVHVPAHATASSSASLTDFTITLYDLLPTDGITPSITFAGNSYTYSWAYHSNPYQYAGYSYDVGSGPFDPSAQTASTSQSTAAASSTGSTPATLTGAITTVVGGLHASGSANGTTGTPGTDNSQYSATAYWNGWNSSGFTLSANTVAVFSATVATSATTTTNYTGNQEYAYGEAGINVSGPSGSGNGGQSSSDTLQSAVYNWNNPVYDGNGNLLYYAPASDTKTGTLGASFVNFTGGSLTGTFYAYANAYGMSTVSAVPEPETYAMMLAGLGAVGFISRRRRG